MAKTIFVTISRGSIARNILRTGIVDALVDAGHRVVMLTPAYQNETFQKEFGREGIVFEPMFQPKRTWVDRVLIGFHCGLVYNATSDIVARYGTYHMSETSFGKWVLHKTVFSVLSRIHWLRSVARWLDERLCPDTDYGPMLERYKPNLVFATNIMEDPDSFLIRAAKARNIPTVGMPKSWDNLSKMFMRTKPGRLIVWSAYMKSEAKRFQNYREDEIVVTGIPQFDLYATKRELPTREAFFAEISADPSKRLICFTSEAKLSPPDPEFVDMIIAAMRDGRIINAQLLVRPHFGFRNDPQRFERFRGMPGVIVDELFTPNRIFYDESDYTLEHWKRLACSLLYADVVVTTFSTMTLDATACRTPVINAMFDGYRTEPYGNSIVRWYDSEHYRPVVATGAAIPARNEAELIDAINAACVNPDIRREQRQRLIDYFIGVPDGGAARRIVNELIRLLA